jgi:hypothetical protein
MHFAARVLQYKDSYLGRKHKETWKRKRRNHQNPEKLHEKERKKERKKDILTFT